MSEGSETRCCSELDRDTAVCARGILRPSNRDTGPSEGFDNLELSDSVSATKGARRTTYKQQAAHGEPGGPGGRGVARRRYVAATVHFSIHEKGWPSSSGRYNFMQTKQAYFMVSNEIINRFFLINFLICLEILNLRLKLTNWKTAPFSREVCKLAGACQRTIETVRAILFDLYKHTRAQVATLCFSYQRK